MMKMMVVRLRLEEDEAVDDGDVKCDKWTMMVSVMCRMMKKKMVTMMRVSIEMLMKMKMTMICMVMAAVVLIMRMRKSMSIVSGKTKMLIMLLIMINEEDDAEDKRIR